MLAFSQYLKGKKWNPSVVKLYSQQETATSGKVSSKEKLDDSELYKGDNAYYTILSELTDIRDIPAVQKFSKELLKSRMDKLELHNKKAYLEFRQAIIAATKYADQPGKFDKMEQAGANVKLAWNAKVKEIVDDIQKSTGYEKTTVNTKTTLSPSVDQ